MKRLMAIGMTLALAASATAEKRQVNGVWYSFHPTKDQAQLASGHTSNLSYHGGAIIPLAKVVPIFWGNYWGSGTGQTEANTMISFFEQFGTNAEYNVITQYYDTISGTRYVGLNTLTNTGDAYFDGSNPPTNVTDADVQAEVTKALGVKGYNASAIYEVFIPGTSYSTNGSAGSCGAPNLQYCAYHGSYTSSFGDTKYSIEPYPNCSGCSAVGFSTIENAEHFACHETREAVTDPTNPGAWYDRRGYEADDKCAWTPAPFIVGGYGYQYEWSNLTGSCVKTR
jgi:hypothetical protein